MKRLLAALALAALAFVVGVSTAPGLKRSPGFHVVYKIASYPRALAGFKDADTARSAGAADALTPVAQTSVHALGRIEPRGGVDAISGPAGARLETLLVAVGQAVAANQELAYVEGHDTRITQKALIATQLAEARAQVKAEVEYEAILDQEAALEDRQAGQLEAAELRSRQAALALLIEKARASKNDHLRLKELRKDPRTSVSEQEVERQRLLMRQDEEAVKNGERELQQSQDGRQARRDKAELLLRKAKAVSRRTRMAIPIDSLETQLKLAAEQILQTVVRAPRAGRVLAILVKPGEAFGPRPLLQLGDTATMYAIAEVPEDQVRLVRPGQTATIECHALSKSYTGTVESSALMVSKNDVLGLDPAAAAYARVVEFKIKIRLDDPKDELHDRTNLQVDVTIELGAPATGVKSAGMALTP